MRLFFLFLVVTGFSSPVPVSKKTNTPAIVLPITSLDKVKEQSLQFQLLRSGNRYNCFLTLSPLIKTKTNITAVISTKKDIIDLLGAPDSKINNNQFIYTLNGTIGCRVIVEFGEDGLVNCCVMKGCN